MPDSLSVKMFPYGFPGQPVYNRRQCTVLVQRSPNRGKFLCGIILKGLGKWYVPVTNGLAISAGRRKGGGRVLARFRRSPAQVGGGGGGWVSDISCISVYGVVLPEDYWKEEDWAFSCIFIIYV
jgi:hypothetical protein